jgi:glutamate N-acetyltransferase / amino-acid N-acetyltransferase
VRLEQRPGGVCAVDGIVAGGVAAGLRKSGRPDVALVDAGRPVVAAGVQTRNQVAAAPVQVTARHLGDGRARAVLLNSGQANACTGPDGLATAEASASHAGSALGCEASDVLVCSTGVIGVQIDPALLLDGIDKVAGTLGRQGGGAAAQAILTTDTVAKESAYVVAEGQGQATVGGMAKGSGMIAPGMATMLCVVTTDALVDAATAQRLLRTAVSRTFDRISVDGCMSTNDAVLLLATGTASRPPSLDAVAEGLEAVCADLASAIVHDGEGTNHVAHLTVSGASCEADALAVARAIADSVLVRTALAGEDPNWGRILAAVGAGPVRIDPDRVAVSFGDVEVCRRGMVAPFAAADAAAVLAATDVDITVDLGLGGAQATVLFSDLTHEYVTINAEYTT